MQKIHNIFNYKMYLILIKSEQNLIEKNKAKHIKCQQIRQKQRNLRTKLHFIQIYHRQSVKL